MHEHRTTSFPFRCKRFVAAAISRAGFTADGPQAARVFGNHGVAGIKTHTAIKVFHLERSSRRPKPADAYPARHRENSLRSTKPSLAWNRTKSVDQPSASGVNAGRR